MAISLEPEFEAGGDALDPDISCVDGAEGGVDGGLGVCAKAWVKVELGIDLVGGAGDACPVEEGVAGVDGHVWGELVAEAQGHFGHEAEALDGVFANILLSGQQSVAIGGVACWQVSGGGAVDADRGAGATQAEQGPGIKGPAAQPPRTGEADLATVINVFAPEIIADQVAFCAGAGIGHVEVFVDAEPFGEPHVAVAGDEIEPTIGGGAQIAAQVDIEPVEALAGIDAH